jgi:xanthine phosphoribosyltransferase
MVLGAALTAWEEIMKLLEDRILKDGQVRAGNILKVDNFLNHQIDAQLLDEIGREFVRLYKDDGITKVLTIEASGIAIAIMAAYHFGVPLVFAKKAKSKNIDGDVYTSQVESFTYKKTYDITVAQRFITPEDRILIIDDFLASGKAMYGLLDICEKAGAEVAGIGICIEKGFQGGGDALRAKGYRVESLAIIDSMSEDGITFR